MDNLQKEMFPLKAPASSNSSVAIKVQPVPSSKGKSSSNPRGNKVFAKHTMKN